MKFRNITAAAALLLGFTMFGPASTIAAPITSSAAGIQTELSKSELVKEAQFRRRRAGRRRFRNRRRRSRRRNRNLLLGLGTAAVVGGIIANSNRPAPRRPYYRRGRFQPWTDAWYNDCFRRYRSFNPDTGYYKSYRRGYVFCR